MKHYIGYDIGGTGIKAGLVTENGELLDELYQPVDAKWKEEGEACAGLSSLRDRFADWLTGVMADLGDKLLSRNGLTKSDVESVGAGIPGTVDDRNGIVLFAPNLPMEHLPLAERFTKIYGLPCRIGNDANCAAFGEYIAGAGRAFESLVLVTLGTGVGTGIVLNGKLWTGCGGAAGEGGHMVLQKDGKQCGCGHRGCFETYASATALIRSTREMMEEHPESLLWTAAIDCWNEKAAACADGSVTPVRSAEGLAAPPPLEAWKILSEVTGKTVFSAAKAGDPWAQAVLDQYVRDLAEGLFTIIHLLQPEGICLGGGISHADPEQLLYPVRKLLEQDPLTARCPVRTQVVTAQLGNRAGMIGAALLPPR